MGLFSGLFGSKSKSKNSFAPWSETMPYLLGQNGEPGVFDNASTAFQDGGFTPDMANAADFYLSQLNARSGEPASIYTNAQNFLNSGGNPGANRINTAANDILDGGYQVAGGAFDSNFDPVKNVDQAGVVFAPQTNLNSARASQGVLDPTKSLSRLLSGRPDNPYLDQQANSITDQITRNMMENIMPGIRSDAIVSGQYGGSRQGLAESKAISNLNRDIAPALTNLYGGAYENAQNRMTGTANALNDQAFTNSTANADRLFNANLANVSNKMNTDQFNANLGLNNNSQQMAKNTTNLDNRLQGANLATNSLGLMSGANSLNNNFLDQSASLMDLFNKGTGSQDNTFANYMSALGLPQDMNWQNLNNYANLIYQGSQLGGTSKGKQTSSPGLIPSILGTAAGVGGLASGFKSMGGMSGLAGLFK